MNNNKQVKHERYTYVTNGRLKSRQNTQNSQYNSGRQLEKWTEHPEICSDGWQKTDKHLLKCSKKIASGTAEIQPH